MANSVSARPDVEGMRRVAEAATSGEWEHRQDHPDVLDTVMIHTTEPHPHKGAATEIIADHVRDAAHIAAWCPTNALAVLDFAAAETKRADAEKREREEVVDEMSATLRGEIERADLAEKAIAHESYACYMEGWLDAAESVELHIANAAWEKSVSKERIGQTTVVAELLARVDAAETALAAETAARIAAEAKVGKMVEALRKFTRCADDLDLGDRDSDSLWESPAAMDMTVGDLRHGARLVAQHDAKGKEAGDVG